DDAEDQIVPLPALLKATGMERKDRDSLLEMIMEISGARETVQEAAKVLQQMNLFGIEGEFMEVTKRMQKVFTEMAESFTRRQKDEIEKRKFTFLEKEQLMEVYRKQGLRREHHEEFDLDEYGNQSYEDREESLWKRIELISANESTQVFHHPLFSPNLHFRLDRNVKSQSLNRQFFLRICSPPSMDCLC
ncbi:hypothetical protein PMAYCL1PPCAC_18052, partial [Pristionchus mayeri]